MKKRVRRNKEIRIEQILEEALKIVRREGWAGLDLKALAEHCGMSASNVIYHFKNREGLLLGLLTYVSANNWQIVSSAQKPEHDAFERLRVHVEKNLDWARRFPEQAHVITQIYCQAGMQHEFSKIFQLMVERAQARIHELLLSGQREGIFHFTLKPIELAKYIHNVLVGAFINITATRLSGEMPYSTQSWKTILKSLVGYDETKLIKALTKSNTDK